MSDNIPFDIQIEIIKKVFGVKSLVRFRSVSKPWKSFIDSSKFIKGYDARNTQPHSHTLTSPSGSEDRRFICLVEDDNNETFKVQQQQLAPFVVSPLLKQYHLSFVVGACHGLQCLYGFHDAYKKWMLVIWNPSIGKSFGTLHPSYHHYGMHSFGFGVCPVTKDPTVVKIIQEHYKPWHVEVFTLSSRVWNVIPFSNLPHVLVRLDPNTQVVIDRFIYWGGCTKTINDVGEYTINMVVSFDLITKEFKVLDLPDSLNNELYGYVRVSNLRESLVVYGSINVDGAECCGVWVMEGDSSFRKLFTIGARVHYILGFRKSCEPIFETNKLFGQSSVDVYDPCSQHIKRLEIDGVNGTIFLDSYKESLLLLDHLDSHIYYCTK